jgi:FkbM family methyltransferase
MFSAIFNAEKSDSRILSVEPDSNSFAFLDETIKLNNKSGNHWTSTPVAMSDFDGEVKFDDGTFGGTIGTHGNVKKCQKLETLCKEHNLVPDIIKLDIESFEYEVITSSSEFLSKINANIQIEIHNDFIRNRGLDPAKIYRILLDLGYRGIGSEGNLNEKQALKPIVHLHLIKR